MWAHYADSGAGMCIGYAVFTGNPRLFSPVEYVEDRILVDSSKLSHNNRSGKPNSVPVFPALRVNTRISLILSASRAKEAIPETVKDFEIVFPRNLAWQGRGQALYDPDN